MAGHALAGVEALDGLRSQPHLDLVLHQLVRHHVVAAVDPQTVVDVYPRLFPFGVDTGMFW